MPYNGHGIRWTPDRISRLRELSFTHTCSELAPIFGCSSDAIRAKALALGITCARKPPAWTPEQLDILRREIARGRTAREIGALVGKTRLAVIGRAYDLELTWGLGDMSIWTLNRIRAARRRTTR